ncbi:hypothetical protein OLMES_2089 [Oleiphilus messinensis]|uniref:Uncharacterized protein n=1 Tax=Oleiphilus messinensis TaxID=141451 RepID=A0A1Y0I6P3_9GAMM|nr:hypothetical protein OLMES_2089 [Oleiphilus messinensis]
MQITELFHQITKLVIDNLASDSRISPQDLHPGGNLSSRLVGSWPVFGNIDRITGKGLVFLIWNIIFSQYVHGIVFVQERFKQRYSLVPSYSSLSPPVCEEP